MGNMAIMCSVLSAGNALLAELLSNDFFKGFSIGWTTIFALLALRFTI